jgi:cysteine desulfuration protein SufE
MSIAEIQQEIIEEFELFDDWEQKYEYIIDLGKKLPTLPESEKTEDRIIKGCQSRVWLKSELKDGKIHYSADSDAIIVKGLVSLLLRVYNQQVPQEIVAAEPEFIDKIGLSQHLAQTRSNGLRSMVKQMKLDAMVLGKLH